MSNRPPLLSRLSRYFPNTTIFHRIAFGNAVIIVVGAVCGTLVTRLLTGKAADVLLIVLFASIGITLSILTNSYIIHSGLRPLHQLSRLVDRVAGGQAPLDPSLLSETDPDPDIKRLVDTLSTLVLELDERNRQLTALSRRAVQVQEEERMRISRSLHDDTGQALSTLMITLDRIEGQLPAGQVEAHERLKSARDLTAATLEELRKIIFDLRPSMLDDLGLVPAIRWYARSNLEPLGVQVRVFAPDDELCLPPELATTLYRISQEAVNNIRRHARAGVVMLTLVDAEGEIGLQVKDDGQGFDPAGVSGDALSQQKLGLLGIQERAQLAGGKVTIESAPGQGTRLYVSIPRPIVTENMDNAVGMDC